MTDPKREQKPACDDETDGCVCDVALEPDEETDDEQLPETNLVPGLDKSPKTKRERKE